MTYLPRLFEKKSIFAGGMALGDKRKDVPLGTVSYPALVR